MHHRSLSQRIQRSQAILPDQRCTFQGYATSNEPHVLRVGNFARRELKLFKTLVIENQIVHVHLFETPIRALLRHPAYKSTPQIGGN
jgi:uncharacterized protein (UPF0216 family)